jgi:uncharacterized protein
MSIVRERGVSSALVQEGADCLVRVWAKPRASRSRVVAMTTARVEIQLAAPPVDGAANKELIEFVSKLAGVSKSQVSLENGASSRHKVVRVMGRTVAQLRAVLVVDPTRVDS